MNWLQVIFDTSSVTCACRGTKLAGKSKTRDADHELQHALPPPKVSPQGLRAQMRPGVLALMHPARQRSPLVARRYLEPILEPGIPCQFLWLQTRQVCVDAVRTGPSALLALLHFVLDIDVKGFFDSIDWELLLKAVRSHTDSPWVLLYIERWLKAPVRTEDSSIVPKTAGTPQGGVISPLLANLFLHYAFDMWMAREFPHIPFERYADDAICHCKSEEEARALWRALADRFAACKLVLHPDKTKIVYCKDANRHGDFPDIAFDFLGFQFRARKTMWQGKAVHGFLPAASPKALTRIGWEVRRWRFHLRSDKSLEDLASIPFFGSNSIFQQRW